MTRQHSTIPAPVDLAVGGDGDTPGAAQPITSDDILALRHAPEPLETRREQLNHLKSVLFTRQTGDRLDEARTLIQEIDDALATLDHSHGEEDAVPAALGIDEEARHDVQPPDEEPPR